MPADEDSHGTDQLGELRSDVRHIQADVSDLKIEVRVVNQRLDALRDRVDQNTMTLMERMDSSHAELRKEMANLGAEIRAGTASFHTELKDVRESIASAKLWAVLMYAALGGSLLWVMARGFKWI